MNATHPDTNITLVPDGANTNLSSLTPPPSIPRPPAHPSTPHDPEFTIMVVLGLSLMLAALAVLLAVRRRLEQDRDSEASCVPGEGLPRRGGSSTVPQLKVWKRLGSYRRSYNASFRRPPHRRPRQQTRTTRSTGSETPQPEAGVELQLTTPCLLDYVTEI